MGQLLEEEEVDLSKVIIGPSGDTNDVDYRCQVADAGSMSASASSLEAGQRVGR